MESNHRRQTWYIARHLKQLSDDLATWGFGEAALLVGAAAISVGDESVRLGNLAEEAPQRIDNSLLNRTGVRHG